MVSMETKEDMNEKRQQHMKTGEKEGSAWLQLRAFVMCLWSADQWLLDFWDDMFFFIHVWLLSQRFIGLCQHYNIQGCISL